MAVSVDSMKISVTSPMAGLPKDAVIRKVELDLPRLRRADGADISVGKVRETFELDGGNLLMVSSDRISVFDVVLDGGIPGKGPVLNSVSGYNLDKADGWGLVPTQTVARRVDSGIAWLDNRAMVVKRAEPLKVEAVVRGYLTGSALKDYQKTGVVFGVKLPEGMKDGSKLPEPMFTPTTKADVGHDEPITFDDMVGMFGRDLAEQIKKVSIELYNKIAEDLLRKGLILADTKFEFGLQAVDGGKVLMLIDEVGTPDSSRYWVLLDYNEGRLVNMDKEPVRQFFAKTGWNKKPPAPAVPEEVVQETAKRYAEVERIIRGEEVPA